MLREIFKTGKRLISRFVCACGLCVRVCGCVRSILDTESLSPSDCRTLNCALGCQNTFKCTAPFPNVSNGAHPASYNTMGIGSFPEVKRPGHGFDHPPPSSAEVKERVQLYSLLKILVYFSQKTTNLLSIMNVATCFD
jgi:hypothetical protein